MGVFIKNTVDFSIVPTKIELLIGIVNQYRMKFFIVSTLLIEMNNTATRGSATSRIPYDNQ